MTYLPVLRHEATDRRSLTWAEFVEAGWLQAYRSSKVPMRELRTFITLLRDEFGVPHPLAHRQPLVSGRQLVFDLQQRAELDPTFRLVDEQLVLTYPGRQFMDRVVWEGELAVGWRPAAEPDSTVLVVPDVRFGRASVGGVSTVVIYDYADEGGTRQEIAAAFGLTVRDVRWALSYEDSLRARREG